MALPTPSTPAPGQYVLATDPSGKTYGVTHAYAKKKGWTIEPQGTVVQEHQVVSRPQPSSTAEVETKPVETKPVVHVSAKNPSGETGTFKSGDVIVEYEIEKGESPGAARRRAEIAPEVVHTKEAYNKQKIKQQLHQEYLRGQLAAEAERRGASDAEVIAISRGLPTATEVAAKYGLEPVATPAKPTSARQTVYATNPDTGKTYNVTYAYAQKKGWTIEPQGTVVKKHQVISRPQPPPQEIKPTASQVRKASEQKPTPLPEPEHPDYNPGSLMYELGFRTKEEYADAQRAGLTYGPHPGSKIPANTIIVPSGNGRYLRVSASHVPTVASHQVEQGNYAIPIQNYEGKEVLLTAAQAEALSMASRAEDQFQLAEQFNIIPSGSVFIPAGDKGWAYIPKESAEYYQKYFPEEYKVLTTEGYDAFDKLFVDVGGGEQMLRKDFDALPKEQKDIVIKQGISGLQKYIESGGIPMGTTIAHLNRIADGKEGLWGKLSLAYAMTDAGFMSGSGPWHPNEAVEKYKKLSQEDKQKVADLYFSRSGISGITNTYKQDLANLQKSIKDWTSSEQKPITVDDIDKMVHSVSAKLTKGLPRVEIAAAIARTTGEPTDVTKLASAWDALTPEQQLAVANNYRTYIEEVAPLDKKVAEAIQHINQWAGKHGVWAEIPAGIGEMIIGITAGIGGAATKSVGSLAEGRPKGAIAELAAVPIGLIDWLAVETPTRVAQDPLRGTLRLVGNLALPEAVKGVKGGTETGVAQVKVMTEGGVLPKALKTGGLDVYKIKVPEGFEKLRTELEVIARDEAHKKAIFESGLSRDEQIAKVREMLNPETREVYDKYLEAIDTMAKFKAPESMIREVNPADIMNMPERSAPAIKEYLQQNADQLQIVGSFADWVQTKGVEGMWRPGDMDINILPKSRLTPELAAKQLADIIRKTSGEQVRASGGKVEILVDGQWQKLIDIHYKDQFGGMPYQWNPMKPRKIEGIPFEQLGEQAYRRGEQIVNPGVGRTKGLMGPTAVPEKAHRLSDVFRFMTEGRGIVEALRKEGDIKTADKLEAALDFVEKAPRGRPTPLTAQEGMAYQQEFIKLVDELQKASLDKGVDVTIEHPGLPAGSLTRIVSPAGKVMKGTVYHATRDITPYVRALKEKGYIQAGKVLDESGKWVDAPRQDLYLSPDVAFDRLNDMFKGNVPDNAGVIAIRTIGQDIGKTVQPVARVEYDIAKGKEQAVVYDELTIGQGNKIYPTDPTGTSLRRNSITQGLTGESLTYYPRTKKTVPILWLATENARKAGLTAPDPAQARALNWMAIKASLTDLAYPHLAKHIEVTSGTPIKGGKLVEFYRETYKWKGKSKDTVARTVAKEQKLLVQEATDAMKAREQRGERFNTPEDWGRAYVDELNKAHARRVLDALSDKDIQKLLTEAGADKFRETYVINLRNIASSVAVAGLGGSGVKSITDLKSSDIPTIPTTGAALITKPTRTKTMATPRVTVSGKTGRPTVITEPTTSTRTTVMTETVMPTKAIIPVQPVFGGYGMGISTTVPVIHQRQHKFRVKEVQGVPKENPGIVSWKQGLYWISVFPPYQKGPEDITYSREPPPDVKRRKRLPRDTAYTWKGAPPDLLKVDVGAFDAHIEGGKRIYFTKDRGAKEPQGRLLSSNPADRNVITRKHRTRSSGRRKTGARYRYSW